MTATATARAKLSIERSAPFSVSPWVAAAKEAQFDSQKMRLNISLIDFSTADADADSGFGS